MIYSNNTLFMGAMDQTHLGRIPEAGSRCTPLALLALCCLGGCASGPRAPDVSPKAAIEEARIACKELIDSRLKAPVTTDIGPLMAEARKANKKEQPEKAVELAQDLTHRCRAETRQREELAQVAHEVHMMRHSWTRSCTTSSWSWR